jgi:ABC-type enterochelin transport system substrate-binding protein
MRKKLILIGTATLALTACSENSADTSAAAVEEVTEARAAAEMAVDAVADGASKSATLPDLGAIRVSLPQLA